MSRKASITKASKQWNKYKESADKALGERRFADAEAVLFAAMMESADFDEADDRSIYTLEKISQCLWYQAKFLDAAEHCQKLVKVHEGNEELSRGDLLAFMIDLALIHHAARRLDQAKAHYASAIQLSRSLMGPNHQCTQKVLSLYADLLNAMGRKEEAAQLGVSPGVMTVNDWLASGALHPPLTQSQELKQFAGSPAKASAVVAKAQVAGPDVDASELQISLTREEAEATYQSNKFGGDIALKNRQLDYAEKLFVVNLKLLEKFAVQGAPLSNALEAIYEVKVAKGQLEEAAQFYKRSHEIKEKALGKNDIIVAHSASKLASIYYQNSNYKSAEALAKKSADIYESVHGKEHPDLACALHNLATLYHVQRKYAHAEQAYKRSLEIKNKVFGSDHPETTRLLKSYSELMKETHREQEADHMSSMASGMITGSWKITSLKAQDQLSSDSRADRCDICDSKLNGAVLCPTCGFDTSAGF